MVVIGGIFPQSVHAQHLGGNILTQSSRHTVTYSAGPHGSLTGTTTQTVANGSDSTAVTAVPAFSYRFSQWSDGSTENPRTDLNVTGDINVTASFTLNVVQHSSLYILSYSSSSVHGSVTGSLSQTVASGSSGTAVTAVPANGYVFTGWSDGSMQNPRTDTNVTSDITVTAQFGFLVTHTLTYSVSGHGSVTGNLSQVVINGSSGSPVTAVPSQGYFFNGWSDGSTANPRTDTNVTADVAVSAQFGFLQTHTLTYASSSSHGTVTGSLSQTVLNGSTGTPVTAVPGNGYVFNGWSDGSSQNPRTDTNVTSNINVTAQFGYFTTHTLTYAAGAHGTITGTLSQVVINGSTGTAVTAVPASGYQFSQWSDGSTVNPRTDTNVISNISVTAQFSLIPIINNGGGGGGGGGNGGYQNQQGIGCALPYVYSAQTGLCQIPVVQQSASQILGSGPCPANLIITNKLKNGAHDGQYNLYNKGVVTQVNILQQQINRILGAQYNQAAGPVDGKFGSLTKQGVERLQMALNSVLRPNPPLVIDGIVGAFTNGAINNSCGG